MGNTTHDGELLMRFARAGDEAPFQELLNRHGQMVFQVCFRVLSNTADAEDAAQAVFLTLAQRARDFALQHSVSLSGWLHTLAWRVAMRLRTAADARRKHEREAGTVNSVDASIASNSTDWGKLRPLLDEALTNLPEKYRLPFVLCHLEERSQEEAAALLLVPKRTVSGRLERARELLRKQLEQRGVVLSAGIVGCLPAIHATGGALPATFIASTSKAASLVCTGNLMAGGLISGQSAALMHQALRIVLWAKLKAAATILIVAGLVAVTGVTSYLALAARPQKVLPVAAVPAAKMDEEPDEKPKPDSTLKIHVRSPIAWAEFDKLERKGLRVLTLNKFDSRGWQNLMVPVSMRMKHVDAREFVEAVAAARGLKVEWLQDGKCAVLHAGASDAEVERCRKDLSSNDAAVRREAAWRAGWLRDVRAVPLLLNAVKDPDAEAARQALVGLRRLNWRTVVLLDNRAAAVIAAELDAKNNRLRREAASALGFCSNGLAGDAAFDKERPLIEKALADPDELVPQEAIRALGRIGGEKALAVVEKMVSERRSGMQHVGIEALGKIGGDKAFALLEATLADQGSIRQSYAVTALGIGARDGRINAEKVLPLMEKILAEPKNQLRASCIQALREIASAEGARQEVRERAQALLEGLRTDNDPALRWNALYALDEQIVSGGAAKILPILENAGGDKDENVRSVLSHELVYIVAAENTDAQTRAKAFAMLEKQFADSNVNVRISAIRALATWGDDKAVALLEKALADPRPQLRSATAYELGNLDSDKALTLLEKVLSAPDTKPKKDDTIEQGGLRARQPGRGPDDDLHQGALISLSNLHYDKTVALLAKAIASPDANAHATACQALGYATSVNGGVASWLQNIGGEKALTVLKTAAVDPDTNVRQKVAYGLGLLGGEGAVALLEKLSNDADMEVRSAAVGALGSVGGEKAYALAQKKLADKDPWMRFMAARAMARTGGLGACAAILDALKLENTKWGREHLIEVLDQQFPGEASVTEAIKQLPPLPDDLNAPKPVKPPTAPPEDKF